MVAPDLVQGDFVSFHRALIHRVGVLTAPGEGPETYSFDLDSRLVSVIGEPGDTINDVSEALAEEVTQTFSEVLAAADFSEVVLSGHVTKISTSIGQNGPKGTSFTIGNLSPNLSLALLPDQLGIRNTRWGACRVLRVSPLFTKVEGVVIERQKVWLRMLDSGEVFETTADLIPTLIARAETVL
jgi:hypothetical protein